jgi:hypothetical protein
MKGLAEAHGKNGHIEIIAPAGTDVTIDDEHLGAGPFPDPVAVQPGAHVVKLAGPDGTTQNISVSVLANQVQSARFGTYTPPANSTPPLVAPTTTGPGANTATPPSSSTPAPSETHTDSAAPSSSPSNSSSTTFGADTSSASSKKWFAPPKNMVPVYIGGGLAVAGFATAVIVGVVIKGNAQSNVDSVVSQIKSNGGGSGTCTNPTQKFAKACSALQDDIDAVNADATVGNVATGVGVAAVLGTGLYWILAAKNEPSSTTTARPFTTVSPILGKGTGGLSVVGTF